MYQNTETMKTYLEYKDEKSHKFWEIEVKVKTVITCYGKIDSDGRLSEKEFDTEENAQKDAQKKIKQKENKGYVVKTKIEQEKKTLKRQPLSKNAKFNFEIKGDSKNNPTPEEFTLDEEIKKEYDISCEMASRATKVLVFEGDVYWTDEDCGKIEDKVILIILGDLIINGTVDSNLRRIIVTGDLKCLHLDTEWLDGEVTGDVYIKHGFVHTDSHCIFECFGEVYTPYLLTNGEDALFVQANSDCVSIKFDDIGDYDGYDYTTANLLSSLVYEVFDSSYEFSVYKFLKWVREGNNPIREFEISNKEIQIEKERKLSDLILKKIKKNYDKNRKTLNLRRNKLKKIPKEVFELEGIENIEVLDLSGNSILKIPKEIVAFKSLKLLSLGGNEGINLDNIVLLENLEELDIDYCTDANESKFLKLPQGIENLKHFTKLRARGHWNNENFDIIDQLVNLEFLEFNGTFPWSNIKKIKSVVFFKSLMRDNSSFIEQQSQLKELKIEEGLGMSDSIYKSVNLEKLVIKEFKHYYEDDKNIDFEKLSNLKKLKHLDLSYIEPKYFDNFSSITKLNNLESLILKSAFVRAGGTPFKYNLNIIPTLKNIKKLTIKEIHFFEEGLLKGLVDLNKLESLTLYDCIFISEPDALPEEFYELKKLPNLKYLDIRFFYKRLSKETKKRLKETFSHIELIYKKKHKKKK